MIFTIDIKNNWLKTTKELTNVAENVFLIIENDFGVSIIKLFLS